MAEIKNELNFGLDNFGKQKSLTQAQTIGQMLVNLLLMKPGQMPSLPHIGIDIKQYLYKFEEDIDVSYIKSQISKQCSALLPYIDLSSMQLFLFPHETESILFIYVPLSVIVEDDVLVIGFKRDNSSNEVTFNYKISNSLNT